MNNFAEIKISEKDMKEIISEYQNGESIRQIAIRRGFNKTTLKNKLVKSGITLRPYRVALNNTELSSIITRYKSGETMSEIGRGLRHDATLIKKELISAGVQIRSHSESMNIAHSANKVKRQYGLDESVFNKISENSAYWIGFLMADGCITDRGTLRLMLNFGDIKHVEKFKAFLKAENPIRIVKNNPKLGDYTAASISLNSKKLCKSLSRFGLEPRKSKTAKVNMLSKNRHYWRGIIDGDGTMSLQKGQAFLGLIGSEQTIEQFLHFTKTITESNPKIRKHWKSEGIYTVAFSSNPARKIIELIYSNCETFLERKISKALEILRVYSEKDAHTAAIEEGTFKMISLSVQGHSLSKIGRIYGISSSAVGERIHRKRGTWKTPNKLAS